jgi:hypothetical protein
VQPADDFDAAFSTVEEHVEVPRHLTEVFKQRRCIRIERGEEQALVALQLSDRDEAPSLPCKRAIVCFLEEGHAHQPPIVPIGPAMIRAGKRARVAHISSAQAVPAVAADVQEGVDVAIGVAHDQDWVFAHVGAEEVARPRDLAFVAEKESATSKDPFEFLLVDLVLDEDATADTTVLDIYQPSDIGFHRKPPGSCETWHAEQPPRIDGHWGPCDAGAGWSLECSSLEGS